ncbi:unnamed protein product [Effrenium voratum]|nr:unnamed protein product [Effrenium voratum]
MWHFLLLAVPAATLDNGLARTPQMGYNSWYDLECSEAMNETTLRRVADAMVAKGLVTLGYRQLGAPKAKARPSPPSARTPPRPGPPPRTFEPRRFEPERRFESERRRRSRSRSPRQPQDPLRRLSSTVCRMVRYQEHRPAGLEVVDQWQSAGAEVQCHMVRLKNLLEMLPQVTSEQLMRMVQAHMFQDNGKLRYSVKEEDTDEGGKEYWIRVHAPQRQSGPSRGRPRGARPGGPGGPPSGPDVRDTKSAPIVKAELDSWQDEFNWGQQWASASGEIPDHE